MSNRLSDIENSIELALEDIERAKIEAVRVGTLEKGSGWPLTKRLWDELDDVEGRLKAVRDDKKFQEALDKEERYRNDMAARADAASW